MVRNNEKGVTMIILVVTLAVFLIIIGIVVTNGIDSVNSTKRSKFLDDLKIVQHSVLEQYTRYTVFKDTSVLKGEKITNMQELKNLASSVGVNLIENDNYYKLDKEDLSSLGIKSTNDIYIVNYFTGEVLNYSRAEKGEKYYIFGINTNEGLESL